MAWRCSACHACADGAGRCCPRKVVNRLRKAHVLDIIREYGENYDRIWVGLSPSNPLRCLHLAHFYAKKLNPCLDRFTPRSTTR